MIRILAPGFECESAKRLGFPLQVYRFDKYVESFDNDIIIRWGQSYIHKTKNGISREFKNVLMPSVAITRNANKFSSSKLLAEVVPVPQLFEKKVPNGITAVVRSIEHAAGSNFEIKEGPIDLKSGQYASEFISTDTEVRVWFCGEETLCAKRVPMETNKNEDPRMRACWSYKFCYEKTPKKLHDDTLKAAEKLGLSWGAADILLTENGHYFLELNISPSIDTPRVERMFKTGLMKLLNDKFGKNLEQLAEFNKMKELGYVFDKVEDLTHS